MSDKAIFAASLKWVDTNNRTKSLVLSVGDLHVELYYIGGYEGEWMIETDTFSSGPYLKWPYGYTFDHIEDAMKAVHQFVLDKIGVS